MLVTRTNFCKSTTRTTTSLVAVIAVVLTSIAFPSTRADEPEPRSSTVAGWWHKQTQMFRNRRRATAKPVAARRQAAPAKTPTVVTRRTPRPKLRPKLRPVPRQAIRRVAAQAPRVPANRAPAAPTTAGYARLNAPLYPSPLQNIPHQVGGTLITNPALAPHEMLYEHEYRALYPPFYYRVNGWWAWTPFGVESHDKWELMGTEVTVRFRTRVRATNRFSMRAIQRCSHTMMPMGSGSSTTLNTVMEIRKLRAMC